MKESILREKSYAFAVRIVKLSQYLVEKENAWVLSKQILRSGTSIGALVRESEYAESHADFAHKLSIALKEANETHYWLCLLKDTEHITEKMSAGITCECEELIKLLTASIKTVKNSDQKGNTTQCKKRIFQIYLKICQYYNLQFAYIFIQFFYFHRFTSHLQASSYLLQSHHQSFPQG